MRPKKHLSFWPLASSTDVARFLLPGRDGPRRCSSTAPTPTSSASLSNQTLSLKLKFTQRICLSASRSVSFRNQEYECAPYITPPSFLCRCTHIVHAIGFEPYTVPVNGRAQAEYDPRKGQLAPGLFGAGIAFPEQVTDPVGNVEFAVGLFKFMKGARRMVPEWIQSSGALQWR